VVALALASFCNDITLPGAWASAMDVGGSFAGTLSGTMNMMGNAGGALASFLAPQILNLTGENWNAVIYVAAGIYFVGIIFWAFLDTVTPITHEPVA
jgi:ACS family glucarate transporter-like MFS transporter